MRTLIIIVLGIALWMACVALVKWRGNSLGLVLPRVTIGFVVAWFILALVNLWLGVTTAGYTVLEELPIFLLIFLVPSVLAVLYVWRERARSKRLGANESR